MMRILSHILAILIVSSVALADRNIYTGETTAAERALPVYLVQASDNETAQTGVTIAAGECRICKNGGSCGNCAGTWTEAEFGLYDYQATSGEIGTLGYITVMIKDSAANVFVGTANIVAYDPTATGFNIAAGGIPSNAYAARGTAQSVTSNTIRLASSEAFADDELNDDNAIVVVSASTGGGQVRCIRDYVSATDTATVDSWITQPTGTITYDIIAAPGCTTRATDIAANAITAAKIATNAITSDEIDATATQEIADGILATTVAELSSLPSSATPTVAQMLRWYYQYGTGKFKTVTTNTEKTLMKDDGSTPLGTCTTNDSGSAYTRGECS